jgi:hypothetical protein
MKRIFSLSLAALVVALFTFALTNTALAGSKGHAPSGITLHFPDHTVDCEPTFAISTTGVPNSFSVQYNIFKREGNSLVQVGAGSSTGNLNTTYTPPALESGITDTYAVFIAVFNHNGVLKLKLSGKWNVTCN